MARENLETDELLSGVVAGLIGALQTVRPKTVRQFFALASQHMCWQLTTIRSFQNAAMRLPMIPVGAAG
jgi:RNA polymerase sigma-70 factor (ECF subfamily)